MMEQQAASVPTMTANDDSAYIRTKTTSDTQRRLAADNIMASFKNNLTPRMSVSLYNGEDITDEIRQMLVNLYGDMYKAGAGELATSAQLQLSRMLLVQYDYLDSFMAQVQGMSIEAIEARLNLYIHSSRQALETGILNQAQDFLFTVELPAMPGDGTSLCLVNCHCYWEHVYDEKKRWVGARWIPNDLYYHCLTCATRAAVWNPLILVGYDSSDRPYRLS